MQTPSTQRVRDARAGLLLTHPFFGVLSLKLELIETADVKTAVVTSKALKFNPAFVDSLSNAELKVLLAHEVMHLGLLHHARQGTRDASMWNDAADYAINPLLVTDGFTLPTGSYIDARFNGKTAEQIYQILRDEQQEQNPQDKDQPESGEQPQPNPQGSFESAGPEDSAEAGDAAREWQEHANEAIRAASSAGTMPAGIKLTVNASHNAKADWRALLRRFMNDQVKTRSTWSKRNKRFPDTYIPGRVRDGMGPLVVAVDTSGSISQPVLDRFAAEITAIAADVEPSQVTVIYCDASVNRVDVYEIGEPIKLTPCGGGGTRFSPVFAHVDANDMQPAALVYLTDMDCSDWPKEPAYPVLWASYGAYGRVAPVGETIAID